MYRLYRLQYVRTYSLSNIPEKPPPPGIFSLIAPPPASGGIENPDEKKHSRVRIGFVPGRALMLSANTSDVALGRNRHSGNAESAHRRLTDWNRSVTDWRRVVPSRRSAKSNVYCDRETRRVSFFFLFVFLVIQLRFLQLLHGHSFPFLPLGPPCVTAVAAFDLFAQSQWRG